ncbi:MAG: inositol monophosphatase [DPANN group archaeon]|nr:inositol monophosphatase [DPANN group archaeon]
MKSALYQALKSGSNELMHWFSKVPASISVKQNQSNVVSQADLKSEKKIIAEIKKTYRNHRILTEESGLLEGESEFTWVVDPLDGSSNFVSRLHWFGISITVLNKYEPVMAGISLPFYNAIYFAAKGRGAFVNGRPIRISQEQSLKNVLVAYSLDYSEDKKETEAEARLMVEVVRNCRNLRATNSVVDLVYTAEGRLGGVINKTNKIWDVAAADLIIREAGGVVTDLAGQPLDFKFNKTDYTRNYSIVAGNPSLHKTLLDIIRKCKSGK